MASEVEVLAPHELAQAEVHMLPCEVQFTGSAPVGAYFKPKQKGAAVEACFRGRQLRGRRVKPPSGFVGAILQDTAAGNCHDGEQRKWLHKSSFDDFTYWQHDDAPTGSEPPFKAMRFAGLASVLHAAPEDPLPEESEATAEDGPAGSATDSAPADEEATS